MRNIIVRLLGLLKKPIFIIGLVIVVGTGLFILTMSGDEGLYEFIVAEKTDVVQEVSVTGRVSAVESVTLAFEKTGTVGQVYADVGDAVSMGQTLVSLRNNDVLALLSQAEAQAAAERAVLAELTNNASSEQNLTNAYGNVLNTINDAIAKSEDAIRSRSVGIFSGSETKGYALTFNPCDPSMSTLARTLRLEAELELDEWNRELRDLNNSSRETLDNALEDAQSHLGIIRQFVDATNNTLLTSCALKNSTLDTARTNMATAQTNVLTSIGNVNTLEQTIASKKISVDNYDAVTAQEAKVKAAESSVENYRVQLSQTILKSPINGIVTKQDAKIGEAVSINTTVVSIISMSGFEVEVNVPEADTAKIKIGNISKLTLDAYGDEVIFEAIVTTIDPAETIIDGVATYKTTLEFSKEDDRIKSGMTANLDILTAEKKSVIAVPQRSVITKDGRKIVRILGEDNEITEANVKTGLRSSSGTIEIVSGVNEGDKVVTFIKEE